MHAMCRGHSPVHKHMPGAAQSPEATAWNSRECRACLSQLVNDLLLCGLGAPLEPLLHIEERLKEAHANLMSMRRDTIQIGFGNVQ